MKNVLILSYYFPPRNRVAAYRAYGFCQHLPKFGWKPSVICEDWPSDAVGYDSSLINARDHFEVYRINSSRPKGFNRFLVRNFYPWIYPYKTPFNWWKQALAKARDLCTKHEYDVIFATHDPLATLSIASILSEEFSIPWVADLRDSWNVQALSSQPKQSLISYHEKRFCLRAAKTITVCPKIAKKLQIKFKRKIDLVENGFDKLPNLKDIDHSKSIFSILYAGSFAKPRQDPSILLSAIEKCIRDKKIPRGSLEVRFLGFSKESFPIEILDKLQHTKIYFENQVSRIESIKRMSQSNLLWVIPHHTDGGVLTAKIFDYLTTKKPIICIPSDDGEIEKFLKRTNSGFAMSRLDEIEDKICSMFNDWKLGNSIEMKYLEDEVKKYSREHMTRKLAELLDSMQN